MAEKENNQEVLNLFADEKEQEELQQINDNLSFNTRSLNTVTEHLVGNLSASQVTIQKILDAMQTSLNQQELIVSKMNDESRVLCLIPQKMQDRIDMIAPKIATEVGVIYNAKIVEINDQFNLLQDKLTKDFDGYRQKLEITTTQCVEQLIDTGDKLPIMRKAVKVESNKNATLFCPVPVSISSFVGAAVDGAKHKCIKGKNK